MFNLYSLAARSVRVGDSAKSLVTLFPVRSFIDQGCFITKTASVGCVIKVNGSGTDGMTEEQMQTVSAAIGKGLQGLSDRFRLYQYTWKHSGETIPAQIDSGNRAASTLQVRKQFLEEKSQNAELFGFDQYWIVVYEPQSKETPSRGALRRRVATLKDKVASLMTDLKGYVQPRLLPASEAFYVLRVLCNLSAKEAAYYPLPDGAIWIDNVLSHLPLDAGKHGIKVGDNHVQVMSLWSPIAGTKPNYFREIQRLKADFILATEWRGLDKGEADKMVAKSKAHFQTSAGLKSLAATAMKAAFEKFFGSDSDTKEEELQDEGKLDNVRELGELEKVLNRGDGLGEYSATLVLYGPDKAALKEAIAEASARLREFNALFAPESYNALNALLSIHPGNTHFNFRRQYIQRSMAADMALAYQEYQGELRNAHLGKECLITCTTQDDTPHSLNLHHEGVFGVFITGKTGAGKSVLSNAFLDNLQKYDPETLVLDVGGSYRHLCKKYDGTYMSLADLKFRCNPFAMDNSPRTRRFLSAFVKMLLENEKYVPDYRDTRIIFDAVEEMMDRPVEQRRLSKLDLGERLLEPLYRWLGKGEYGSVFDNIEDEITFTQFKVFDFQGIEDVQEIAEPLFFYLFMRHERIVQDPALAQRFKILWADEAWRFIENTTCRNQFVKAGKTYRKHNGGIALATQSAFDFKNAGLFEIISEVCPTKILLANPSADMKAYAELFHLNERELENFRTLIGKRQFMVKKEEQPAQVLNLLLSPYELVQYQNSPFENARRDKYIAQYGWEQGLHVLAAEMKSEEKKSA